MLPWGPTDIPTLISAECFICIRHDSKVGLRLSIESRPQVPVSSSNTSESIGMRLDNSNPDAFCSTRCVADPAAAIVEVLILMFTPRTKTFPIASDGLWTLKRMRFACPRIKIGGSGCTTWTCIDGVYAGKPSGPGCRRFMQSFCCSVNGRLEMDNGAGEVSDEKLLLSCNGFVTLFLVDRPPNRGLSAAAVM